MGDGPFLFRCNLVADDQGDEQKLRHQSNHHIHRTYEYQHGGFLPLSMKRNGRFAAKVGMKYYFAIAVSLTLIAEYAIVIAAINL